MKNLKLSFPSPIWKFKIDNHQELNQKLEEYILNLKNENPEGVKKSNINGWHSTSLEQKQPIITKFIQATQPCLTTVFQDMQWDPIKNKAHISSLWSIINPPGALNSRHYHPENFLSAAYYVKTENNCGNINFYDPVIARNMRTPKVSNTNELNAKQISITPEAGDLILFPSYFEHSVDPNLSDKNRIIISFNINLDY